MYVYVYICMYVYVYICMCMYACVFQIRYVCVYAALSIGGKKLMMTVVFMGGEWCAIQHLLELTL